MKNAGLRRKLLWLAVVVVASGSVLTIAGTAANDPDADRWAWGTGDVPGQAITLDRAALGSLEFSDAVTSASVRELVATTTPGDRFALLAARDINGKVCFSAVTTKVWGGFSCMNDLAEDKAFIHYSASGGSSLGATEWSSTVGVVRGDVRRLVGVTRSGVETGIALNQWRGFGYRSTSFAHVLTALRAYDEDGSLIQETPVG
ncbi:MAG: hypothetical protein WKF65_10520 [Gaiellaceae bacterium]